MLHLYLKIRDVGQHLTRIRTMVFNIRARTVQPTGYDHLVGLETVSSTIAQLSAYRERSEDMLPNSESGRVADVSAR